MSALPPVSQSSSITLHVGQAVAWPPAPLGFAQIEQLGRKRVRLVYRCSTGLWRHPLVRVDALDFSQPPLPMHNPLARGITARSKCYPIVQTQRT